MNIVRTMLQLLRRSASERSIAKELNISRNTIAKYKEAFKASSNSYKQLLAMDDSTLSENIYPAVSKPKEEPESTDSRLEAFEAKT